MSIFRNLLMSKKSRLPSAYQEVEWIKSTGTQYINTGVQATQLIGFDFEGNMGSAPIYDNRDCVICGSASGGSSSSPYDTYRWGVWYCWNVNTSSDRNFQIAHPIGQHSYRVVSHTFVEDEEIALSYNVDSNVCIYNGTSYSLTRTTRTANNIGIFATITSYGVGRYGKIKLKNLRLYNNGSVIRDFVPCYRKSDNEIGLYDVMTGQFYTNQGTGTFEKGGNI